MMNSLTFFITLALMSGCTADDVKEDQTILLTVENRTGAQLWYFDYRDCADTSGAWTYVIGQTEYVANGTDVSSTDLTPGCYDLYVEDEYQCWSENSTDGNIAAGLEFIWTVTVNDLTCP